jgi:hypothetical protein
MRHLLIAAVALYAATLSLGSARAERFGPIVDEQGRCKVFNGNSNNLNFFYWVDPPCQSTEPRRGGVGTRTVRVTAHGAPTHLHYSRHHYNKHPEG